MIFIQEDTVGNQSFHFTFDDKGPYVNYKNCPMKLDNGDPLPEKKYFENYSYTAGCKTFRGEINFEGEGTFFKIRKIKYEMKFDDGF